MHENNLKWLKDLRNKYPDNFDECTVLEVASCTSDRPNCRDMFATSCQYLGIDKVNGHNVDWVVDAKEFKTNWEFDTLVILSLFEHDPGWKESFSNTLQFLKKGGLIILCWDAEGNLTHNPEPWSIVTEKEYHNFAKP